MVHRDLDRGRDPGEVLEADRLLLDRLRGFLLDRLLGFLLDRLLDRQVRGCLCLILLRLLLLLLLLLQLIARLPWFHQLHQG